jgi:hypothetical protein
VERRTCRSIKLRKEELAYLKAMSTLQLFPVILRELKLAMLRRKKKPAVLAGNRRTKSGGARATNDHLVSWRASAKPTTWQAQRLV